MWRSIWLLPLAGCFRLVTAPLPMKSLEDAAPRPAKCLVVFLPGVADHADTFREQGFIDELRARKLSVDAIAAEATVGYYLRGIEAPALDRDVVSKALDRHYDKVWLVGVSMGGFGALHYAASFPLRVDGVLVLAPHLGEETVLQQLRDAGGLEHWQPPRGRDNYTVNTWRWLKTQQRVPIYVGYGENDPITGQPLLLADAVPPTHVLHRAGGHTWATWRRLWAEFLDRSLTDSCGTLSPPSEADP